MNALKVLSDTNSLQQIEVACLQIQEKYKVFRLVAHCLPKTYKVLFKRCPFTVQKGIFYFVKVHLLFSIYESLLHPFLCPFPFHNKQVSRPLHYYNNTIKTTTFQFSCHSCHSSPHHNALITSSLCEMLKVTATKNKNYIRVLE